MSQRHNTTFGPGVSPMREFLDILLECAVNPEDEVTWSELIYEIQTNQRLELHPSVYFSFVAQAVTSNEPYSTLLRKTPTPMECVIHESQISPLWGSTNNIYAGPLAPHRTLSLHKDYLYLERLRKKPKGSDDALYSQKISNAVTVYVRIDRHKWIVPEQVFSCTSKCFRHKWYTTLHVCFVCPLHLQCDEDKLRQYCLTNEKFRYAERIQLSRKTCELVESDVNRLLRDWNT